MLLTATQRAAQATLSMQSVPVAATAISFSCGSCSSVAAVIVTLFRIATVAPASRGTTCSGVLSLCSISSCAKAGARRRICGASVARSRKTMRCGAFMRGRFGSMGEQDGSEHGIDTTEVDVPAACSTALAASASLTSEPMASSVTSRLPPAPSASA